MWKQAETGEGICLRSHCQQVGEWDLPPWPGSSTLPPPILPACLPSIGIPWVPTKCRHLTT